MNPVTIKTSTIYNCDCMELMKQYADKHFDLAIVDPPYGIDVANFIPIVRNDRPSTYDRHRKYEAKDWDKNKPKKEYFESLFRISKNQIIWGGNYFTSYLYENKAWVYWDKVQSATNNFSHGELAWTSFNKQLMQFVLSCKAETHGGKTKIHPTQKPVKLYEWLLTNYAKEGDKILDTHLGSGSHAIACNNLGFELIACELDKDYFEASIERIKREAQQERLF